MPATGGYNNTSALFRAAVPQQSFAQLSAMKDRDAQLLRLRKEEARIANQENQAKVQAIDETALAIQRQDLEAPDKQRLGMWFKGKQRELYAHLQKNYKGNEKQFFEAEMGTWLKNTLSDMMTSDLYATAQSNKQNVFLAKQALGKKETLTGRFDEKGNYVYAQRDLLDFMEGKKPTFQFQGSYEPNTQAIYDYFGKMDNPYGSKYDRNAVATASDVQNRAVALLGEENGRDAYHRFLQGRSVPYKRYSLEDQQLFNLDVANKQSAINGRKEQLAQGWRRIEQADQRLAKEDQNSTEFSQGMQRLIERPIRLTPVQPVTAPLTQKLKSIGGVSLGELITPIKQNQASSNFSQLSGIRMDTGLQFAEISSVNLAPLHDKFTDMGGKNGKIKEGILPDGTVLDMSTISHRVATSSNTLLVDQGEMNRIGEASRTGGKFVYPSREFRKTTVFIPTDAMTKNKIPTDGAVAQKVKEPDPKDPTNRSKDREKITGYFVDVLSPSTGFFQSPEVQHLVNKGYFGQKGANEIYNSNEGVDEFPSLFDSTF